MGFGDTFRYYAYASDNGNTYVYKQSQADAAAADAGGPVDPLSLPAWPYNTRDLRHVTGVEVGGFRRARLIMPSASQTLFVSGGQWTNTNTGITYQALGAEGERRPASHVGG